MTDFAGITWHLDAYAGHWLADDELSAVTEWMSANGLDRATAQHPVTVADGLITYGRDDSPPTVRAAQRVIATVVLPLRTTPPTVWRPDCDEMAMATLRAMLDQHEWSCGFNGVCVDCSAIQVDDAGRVYCRVDDAVAWPCSPMRDALFAAGVPVPGERPLRILGDCLDEADNARIFAAVS